MCMSIHTPEHTYTRAHCTVCAHECAGGQVGTCLCEVMCSQCTVCMLLRCDVRVCVCAYLHYTRTYINIYYMYIYIYINIYIYVILICMHTCIHTYTAITEVTHVCTLHTCIHVAGAANCAAHHCLYCARGARFMRANAHTHTHTTQHAHTHTHSHMLLTHMRFPIIYTLLGFPSCPLADDPPLQKGCWSTKHATPNGAHDAAISLE